MMKLKDCAPRTVSKLFFVECLHDSGRKILSLRHRLPINKKLVVVADGNENWLPRCPNHKAVQSIGSLRDGISKIRMYPVFGIYVSSLLLTIKKRFQWCQVLRFSRIRNTVGPQLIGRQVLVGFEHTQNRSCSLLASEQLGSLDEPSRTGRNLESIRHRWNVNNCF